MNLSIMTGDRINPYHSKKKYNNSFTYYCSSICRAISENISGKRRTHDSSAQVVRPSILIYYIYTNIYIYKLYKHFIVRVKLHVLLSETNM